MEVRRTAPVKLVVPDERYNAAKNIGVRYARKQKHSLRSSPKSGNGDAPVNARVNGGTLNSESYQPIAGD